MISTGIMFGAGDCLAQKMFPSEESLEKAKSEKFSSYDLSRTLRAVTYGCVFFAPIVVLWQGRILPSIRNPFINLRRAVMSQRRVFVLDTVFRVFIDQLFMPSLVFIPLYNTVMVMLAMHDDPFEVIKQKLTNGWWKVLKASWTIWPPFQLVNLLFIPLHLRIIAANVWSIGWNCFLSFCHNTKGHGKGSGHRLEELVDIQDGEIQMAYD